MFQNNQTVDAKPKWRGSKRQLKRSERRLGVIIQVDNARRHIANMTGHAIKDLGFEVLPHTSYYHDLATFMVNF